MSYLIVALKSLLRTKALLFIVIPIIACTTVICIIGYHILTEQHTAIIIISLVILFVMFIMSHILMGILYHHASESSQKFRDYSKELKHLNVIKADFVSMVTHELRTPLTAIKEVINHCHADAKVHNRSFFDQCVFARLAVDRLLRLTDNLWSVANVEAGRVELRREKTSPAALINSSVNLLNVLARDKDITINIDLPEPLCPVFVDTDKILQILLNIIDNAIKFTPAGGRIDINVRQIDGFIEVNIKDTGVGMSQEESAGIFNAIPDLSEEGLGKMGVIRLGLRLSRLFIEMHGGQISVQSVSQQGSNFRFTLPVAAQGS